MLISWIGKNWDVQRSSGKKLTIKLLFGKSTNKWGIIIGLSKILEL
jgi:hypothetical protein